MNFLFVSKILLVLTNAGAILLSAWVYLANRKDRLNQWFVAMTVFIDLWVNFAFLGSVAKSPSLALLFFRLNYGMVALFVISAFYFCVIYFLKKEMIVLRKIILCFGLLFFLFNTFSPFVIKSTFKIGNGNQIIFGWFNHIFNVYVLFVGIMCIWLLISNYIKSPKEQKLKTQYFLIGTFLFVLSGFILNILVPTLKGCAVSFAFGDYSTILFLLFTAYAIVKRNLFGIKVLLTQTLAVIMSLTLLILPFLINILWLQIILAGVFVLSCFFGYLLIKNNLKEIKQKEILEQAVAQRTAQLQKAFDELKAKNDELEKFYHLTVGRELKMVELKNKIKQLEK